MAKPCKLYNFSSYSSKHETQAYTHNGQTNTIASFISLIKIDFTFTHNYAVFVQTSNYLLQYPIL